MKGMLYRAELLPKVMDGAKTVTRRLDGLKEINQEPDRWGNPIELTCSPGLWDFENNQTGEESLVKPRYSPGEIVYVKEKTLIVDNSVEWMATYFDEATKTVYPPELFISKHLVEGKYEYTGRTLPAWAARTFLKILSVRPERLQEICNNQDDAIAEGVIFMGGLFDYPDNAPWCASYADQEPMKYPSAAYGRLWNSINKPPHDWASNPWVWRIEFKLTTKPEAH